MTMTTDRIPMTTPIDDHKTLAIRRIASAWRWDDQCERLAADPALLDGLPPAHRLALGTYETAKAAAESLGIDTSNPEEQA
jgi:hypothetical protein